MFKSYTWSIGPSGPSGQGGKDGKWKVVQNPQYQSPELKLTHLLGDSSFEGIKCFETLRLCLFSP